MIKCRILTIAILLWSVVPIMASDTATEPFDTTLSLSELTVTAIKQSTNLRDQATASTTINREQLERNRVVSVKNSSELIPNLFIPDYGSRMTSTIYVRGIGARIDQPAVGLNIDNIPVMTKENYDFDMPDIARVEMLRGPQSTLFGRNTMGGVINVYTLSPLNYQGTRMIAEWASHNTFRLGASHYAKLNQKLGLSASIYHNSTDGFFRNQYNGRRADWEHTTGARAKMQWQPDHTLSVLATLNFSNTRQGGYPYEYQATKQIAYNDTCFYKRTSVLGGLTVNKQFNLWKLTSLTSYQYINDNMTLDQDFTPEPYFTLTQARREHAVTEDLIARSTWQRDYNWLCGIFGFYKRYNMHAPVTFYDTGIRTLIEDHVNTANPSYPISWDTRSFELGSNFTSPSWGVAAYHQSSYKWNKFVFTAGLRLDYEHATLNWHSTTSTGYNVVEALTGNVYRHDAVNIDDNGNLSRDFLQLLPKFSITFDPQLTSPTSLFISVSKGYKSGGFNTQMFSDVLQQRVMGVMGVGASYNTGEVVSYKPEKAWNFEIGGHFECWQGRVKSDLGLFYIDGRDRQLTVFPDGTTTGRVMTNAGKTRNWGAEIAIAMQPTSQLSLNVSYGYTNAKFVEFNDGRADYAHNYIPYSPSHTLHAECDYRFDLHTGSDWLQNISIGADVNAVGEIYWNEANTMRQPFYALLGSHISLQGKHYTLKFWGTNLTDTSYNTFYFVSIGHEFLQRGKPRMIGATLSIEI